MTTIEWVYIGILTVAAVVGMGEFIGVEWRAYRLNRRDRKQGTKSRKEHK